MSSYTFGPSAIATPANIITAVRVAFTPVIAILFIHKGPSVLVALLWVFVSVTDGADGWLARRQGTTRSGAFLDPLADKILVFGVFFAIVAKGYAWWLPIAVMAVREVAMSYYRAHLGRRGVSVPARPLGKAKTVAQLLAIFVIVTPGIGGLRGPLSVSLIWIAAVLALVSGYFYFIDGSHPAPRAL
ncbi:MULTISPECIES: CDP-alcohol phosphatidyltransferase family protein [Acidithrix]|uniref:CDP-diacylglycerol--glycerol-3-phosphate 3-phosphatidyltransferase n=1 Tax=Acidithrix ferrooxidans TaxID=1280514 RepID=A0A0D8HML8_9ACTN|nr:MULTISPECIES: CDP-alcohol phosphatidyltransferase family protein [Acidithrix]KJF18997.1 CDP-diacylglycerol--glycerol-3-phosphate 3-phosphatidyltransferase [Acidithrix ferrooxidans]